MIAPNESRPQVWRRAGLTASFLAVVLAAASRAQTAPDAKSVPVTEISPITVTSPYAGMSPILTTFGQFVDGLPGLLNFTLPTLGPEGLFRFYIRPRLGDILHKNYLRVPVGVRAKLTPRLEVNAELQDYFTHGLRHNSGDGLSGLLLGVKHEQTLPRKIDAAWSIGVNFITPLSRPPVELSDGFRHTLPYLGATYTLMPKWRLVGYSTVAADLLEHTALAPRFGRNQLHSDSLSFVSGVARDFQHYRLSLTASAATTAAMSNETDNVFGLRPNVLIPIRPLVGSRLRLLLNVGGRAIWGPDGTQFGVSSSMSVEFDLKAK